MPQLRTRVGKGGRVVLPAPCRKSLGIKEGDELVVSVDDGSVRLMTMRQAIASAQALVRKYAKGRNLVDEFIRERRAEAARE